jgi:hypothetical protein
VFGAEDAVSYDAERIPPEWSAAIALLEQGDKARFWFELPKDESTVPFMADFELLQVQPLPSPPAAPRELAAAPVTALRAGDVAYRVLKRRRARAEAALALEMNWTGWTSSGRLFYTSVGKQPLSMAPDELPAGMRETLMSTSAGSEILFWVPAELGATLRFGRIPGWPLEGLAVLQVALLRRVATR